MAANRINISNKFENGDIPSQNDFGEIFDSFIHKEEDKANIQMVEAGTDNQHYVTSALLRAGLQNVNGINGNCYFPIKENFDDYNGSTIFLKESPIKFSIQVFKNGQLLREEKDYILNQKSNNIAFTHLVTGNIEIDYWHKNLDSVYNTKNKERNCFYKVYTALLKQSGASFPNAIVLENTLGGTVVWSRNTNGQYFATLTGAFAHNRTAIFLGDPFLTTKHLSGSRKDDNSIALCNTTVPGGILLDEIESATIEIRVYNAKPEEITNSRGKFISTWKSDNLSANSSQINQIKLPLIETGTYDMIVNWGDGTMSEITSYNSTDVTHTYPVAGIYEISIDGVCTGWQFQYTGDKLKILTVSQWGILKLGTNEGRYFQGCENLDLSTVNDILDLNETTSLSGAFSSCGSLTTINRCNEWNLNSVTNLSSTFLQCSKFDQSIENWNTSNITDMSQMFYGAAKFNQSIENWDTSKVNNMKSMFNDASSFNQPLQNWNTNNVVNMSYMFSSASAFNQPLANWNTNNVTNMGSMFTRAKEFNQPIKNWNTSKVTNMSAMFWLASKFNKEIGNWDTSNVIDMSIMFCSALKFNQPLENWNTSNVKEMTFMFGSAKEFNQPIGNWDISKVEYMSNMFSSAETFNHPIGNWDTSKVTYMSGMFSHAYSFNQSLENWNTSNVISMDSMFSSAKEFDQPINNWNTSRVTDMSWMFYDATKFNQNIGSWRVSNVWDFSDFMGAKNQTTFSLENLDAIYNGWSKNRNLQVNISFGSAKYTSASAAGRSILTQEPNYWRIEDGGIIA